MPFTDAECKCGCWFTYNSEFGVQTLCKLCKQNEKKITEYIRECINCKEHFKTAYFNTKSCTGCYQRWRESQESSMSRNTE